MRTVLSYMAVLSLFIGGLQASDRVGSISQSDLAKMGLAGMTSVSDRVGHSIRGKGFKNPAGNFYGYKPGGGFKNPAGNFKGYKPGANPK